MLMFSYAYFSDRQKKYNAVQSYADCVSSGNPIIETYPQTCKIPGKIFTNTSQISIKKTEEEKPDTLSPKSSITEDYKNTRYTIEGTVVTLQNGTGSAALLHGSESLSLISYFGDDVNFDANNDTKQDVAFLLVAHSEIGSSLYYLALALGTKNEKEQRGSNAIFLGEMISPQSLHYLNNVLTFSYGEPKTKKQKATIMRSKNFSVVNDVLVESK